MSVDIFKISDFVKWLRAIPAIAATAPSWIFSRISAINESALNSNYILVRKISDPNQTQSDDGEVRTQIVRLEVSFIWWNNRVTDEDLEAMHQVFDDTLLPDPCTLVTDFNWMTINTIRKVSSLWPAQNALNKPIILADYFIIFDS